MSVNSNIKLSNEALSRLSVDEFKNKVKVPLILVLDNIRSLNNIGSVFRTADAFLIKAIYLCGITAQPPHREIQKTALGATETVEWNYFSTTIEAVTELKRLGYKLVAIEQTQNSTMLNDFKCSKDEPLALIFGNEVLGVEQEVINEVDEVVEIPQYGTKHSLNISVSVGVVVWDVFNKMQ